MEINVEKELTLASPVAPEDLRPGSYVAILHMVWEHLRPPCDFPPGQPVKPTRSVWLPAPELAGPLKVREVCIPYVLVEQPGGGCRTIDLRRYQLARLSESFGAEAFKALAPEKPEKAESARQPE